MGIPSEAPPVPQARARPLKAVEMTARERDLLCSAGLYGQLVEPARRPPTNSEPAVSRLLFALTITFALTAPVEAQNPREKKVRDDKVKVEADGFWIYNNLPKAIEQAK